VTFALSLLRSHRRAPSLLVLVGLPGAGKSTFAAALAFTGSWTVVSSDAHMSTEACVEAASAALRAQQCVVIDRCNTTEAQRRVWLELAAAGGRALRLRV